MLCIVPKIKKSYDNWKILIDITNLNSISCKFLSDFKVILMVNGQQTAISAFPCPYCFVIINDLKNKVDLIDGHHTDSFKLKSFGDLRVFDGNGCRKLLNEADKIFESEMGNKFPKLRLVPIVAAFKEVNII